MELTRLFNIPKLVFVLLLALTSCSDKDENNAPTDYSYYYPTEEATITAKQIGDGTGALDPRGITIANAKLYVCNGDVLEIFDAKSLKYIKSLTAYTKGTTTIPFTNLSSVSVDNNRIYLGSVDSRLFVLDENTNLGINTVGNGQWWNTFVHVFGVTVKDGLVFVKEKHASIKVFETSQITESSNWNLTPIAKLNTLSGFDEMYSMDVAVGNLVVAGRDSKAYLLYNIAAIRANAAASLVTPLQPSAKPISKSEPTTVSLGADWAITSENVDSVDYLRFYPKEEFLNQTYTARINATDIMGKNSFGTIMGITQLEDRIFLSDKTNKQIRILKLKKSNISEQK
ncbi:hypothetical protein SGQ83_09000 [Flavobacterium sp. Fl-318]|uniref:Uncharacterized protein n=1 Tax=Flavobacterium cupriresistens TaxID=2893885 RepID=A0ABU4RBW2_9FLAO|nr:MULTISPECIES: hypothetical protein [unclassified Flavobacterium]MDX6189483.1 hypothetical protein [Flavobacterium sp. Fl-318]UFH41108.1 hypothetical protein LNP23_14955 [Flavobacterium sp. F-323]